MSGAFEKWFKWMTTTFFSLCMRNDVAPRPSILADGSPLARRPGFFLRGGGYCWLRTIRDRCLVKTPKRSFRQIAWTINNLKKIVPDVDDRFISASLKDHRSLLTRRPGPEVPPDWRRFGDHLDCGSLVANRIRHICRDIGSRIRREPSIRFKFPSTSAAYNVQRRDGGAFGTLRPSFQRKYKNYVERNTSMSNRKEVLDGLTWWGQNCLFTSSYLIRLYDESSYECRYSTFDSASEFDPPRSDLEEWDQLFGVALDSDEYEDLNDEQLSDLRFARRVPIIEPCKVRVITAGPTNSYFHASRLQKVIHRAMRKMKIFRAIGRTVEEKDIEEICMQGKLK
jgi:hypothetical protein